MISGLPSPSMFESLLGSVQVTVVLQPVTAVSARAYVPGANPLAVCVTGLAVVGVSVKVCVNGLRPEVRVNWNGVTPSPLTAVFSTMIVPGALSRVLTNWHVIVSPGPASMRAIGL